MGLSVPAPAAELADPFAAYWPAVRRRHAQELAGRAARHRQAWTDPHTGTAPEDYLRFRHLVHNLCTWNLHPDRVADLVLGLPALIQEMDADPGLFLDFLAGASRAD